MYALEGPDELARALKELFAILRAKPGVAFTSELTLAEVLPKRKIPDRHFLDLIVWSGIFELRPITRDILIETAAYRRANNWTPKLPDAIHVVTAVNCHCEMFLSSDQKIRLPDGIARVSADVPGISDLISRIA